MKYLVIGAGGTGGAIAGYMGRAGKDVTLIARGEHLEAMRAAGGLRVMRPEDEFLAPLRAIDGQGYAQAGETPDVIFVCVKYYSLDAIVPFIRQVAGPRTVVIPILNVYGTGALLQEELPGILVTDGCIYVASEKRGPGAILMSGSILRIVFGVRDPADGRPELASIKRDLDESGIEGVLSDDIRRDALLKFSYVSPQGACGLYYGIPAGPMQHEGRYRDAFVGLVGEIDLLAHAMGIDFGQDVVRRNLEILDGLTPDMTTSMQKDIAAGHPSEIDGLIYSVVRWADEYGVELPLYAKVAAALKERLGEQGA